MARYCALFSGSKGNCTYIGTLAGGILVDVGVSAKRIREALYARDIPPESIRGVFITHEHSDHIAGLKVLTKQYGWTVYASKGTLSALTEDACVSPVSDLVPLDMKPVTVGDMQILPFHTPHDARESMGFCIETPDERKIAVATDMGVMRQEVQAILAACDLVHIESNHDIGMLRNGSYPYYLKERILSNNGHLSNAMCAATVSALAQAGVTRFTLAHLSEQNNTPALALSTTRAVLARDGFEEGREYLLEVASPVSQNAVTVF